MSLWTSTADPAVAVSFTEAVRSNVPPGGGLYLPARLAPLPDVPRLLELGWLERAPALLRPLLGPEPPEAELDALLADAFSFPAPLVEVREDRFALELFHGPTLSFKDFGARFLARFLAWAEARGGASPRRLVITATSGDTGSAVAQAFWGLPGFRVAVLYPRGRVSPFQELQMATLGGNVRAFAVDGSFDDCQRLVKACFADGALSADLGLTSANSINVARLVAQVLYYFEAVAQLRRHLPAGPRPWIAVPSGNFGNLCAGLLAARLGLPLAGFVAATNANRTVPDYLETGDYRPRPSLATLSNAMDVGDPNNWQRISWLFGDEVEQLRRSLRWGSAGDPETREALAALAALGYAGDPHGAVAWHVLERSLGPGEVGIFLATAHPAKFEATAEAAGPVPALAELARRPLLSEPLPNSLELLRSELRAWRPEAAR